MLAAALALALAPAPASAPVGPSGTYRANQPEIGAALELSPDGRFRYQLDYGAVSESGAGKWGSDGKAVFLTSDPMPKAPDFEFLRDEPLPKGKLAVGVAEPDSPYFASLDVVIAIDGGAGRAHRIGKDETIDLTDGKVAVVTPFVPVTGERGTPIPLDLTRGHRLTLKFLPNDLGQARFEREALAIEHGDLLLRRYDVTIRFARAQP